MKQIEYYEILKDQLDRQVHEEADAIEKAAQYCAESVCKKRLIHVFGCGHSQMFAMEVPHGRIGSGQCVADSSFGTVPEGKIEHFTGTCGRV